MNEWDFPVAGICGNVYSWLFHNARLKHLKLFGWTHIIIAVRNLRRSE